MMRNLKDLENYTIAATDGDIGQIKDFYFEDDSWVVRYLIVESGSWLSSRRVLISPVCVDQPRWSERSLPVSITQEQVKNSPVIDSDQPVTRQNEEQLLGYYGYPAYWGGAGMWGEGLYPYAMVPGYAGLGMGMGLERADRQERERDLEAHLRDEQARHRNDDPHLRSCNAVQGYHIHATDGDIGHVAGYLVDDETWAIRYLVIDTSNWWLGHKVLVAPSWINGVHWSDETVSVDMSRAAIRVAPAYDAEMGWGREQELDLYRHYGRAEYWG